MGIRRDRRLVDDRSLTQVRSGEHVTPVGLSFPVIVARYYLPRSDGREMRFVVATFRASGRVISRWGKHRWRIEAFFKTAKSRFGLARFAQGTTKGVYRFLVLSLLAFTLSQWGAWSIPASVWPDWRELASALRRALLPDLVRAELLAELERLRPYLDPAELPEET